VGIALLDLTTHNGRGKKFEGKRNMKRAQPPQIKQRLSTSINAATKSKDLKVMA
jgi:hypothetical protein